MAIIPSEIYGTSAGFSQYDHDQAVQAQTQHTQVLSRLGTAQAAEVEQKTRDEARMMQIMSGEGAPAPAGQEVPNTTQSLLDRVEGISEKLMKAGYVKAGGDMAVKASTMRAHDAQIRREQMDERFKVMDRQEKAVTQLDGLLVGIDGPESFVAAKDAWRQAHPDDPIPTQFDHYDPRIIDALRHGTKEGMAQLKSQREELRQENLESAREERMKETRFRDMLAERRLQDSERRADAVSKTGGTKATAASSPPKEMINQANYMILEEFPDVKDARAGFAVAADAKARMTANKGISADEALQQAYTAAKADGDFAKIERPRFSVGGVEFGGTTSETKYSGRGKTAETALSMPEGSGGKPPPASSFKAGRYYMTSRGVAKWTGKNFVGGGGGVAPGSSPSSGRSSSSSSSSSDDEGLGVE